MEAAGFAPEDYEDDYLECWPENWPAFDLFIDLRTQWRVGMNGPEGLDYLVLFRLMDDMGLSRTERQALFDDVRVLERAALNHIRK